MKRMICCYKSVKISLLLQWRNLSSSLNRNALESSCNSTFLLCFTVGGVEGGCAL